MMVDTDIYKNACHIEQKAKWIEIHFELSTRKNVERATTPWGTVMYQWDNEIHHVEVEVEEDGYEVALFDLTTRKRVAFNQYQYTNH